MSSIPDLIFAAAQQQGVDPGLLLEVAQAESSLNPNALGPVLPSGERAVGIMQLLPSTATQLGVDPHDLQQNITGGAMYLAQQIARFGDAVQGVAAYDWGPSNVAQAVAQYGSTDWIIAAPGQAAIPAWLASAPAETQNYVAKIFRNLSTQYSVTPSIPVSAPAGGSASPFAPTNPPGGSPAPGPAPPAPQGASGMTVLVMAALGIFALWMFSEQ